jgi:hypothetical protein
VRFLRRTSTTTEDSPGIEAAEVAESVESHTRGYTPAKRRGPVAPPPKTMREAMKRNRELRKSNPTSKEDRRRAAKERQERMAAGDDRYLLPRDKGPVKAYVRDLVDSRRHFLGAFMPLAILVFIVLLVPYPVIQQYVTLLCMLALAVMAIEGYFNGRRIARLAREKFPKETISGRSVGWYAFVRASQIRKLRMPKPRVKVGEAVS